MERVHFFARLSVACAAILVLSAVRLYASEVVITEEEAKLPPPKGGTAALEKRGVTRGPKIELVSSDPVHSPTHLQIKFVSFGGAKIDTGSVKVTYLRSTNVDLTERLKPFVQPSGIDIPDAQLPIGDHTVRLDLKDSDGHPATALLVLKVTP